MSTLNLTSELNSLALDGVSTNIIPSNRKHNNSDDNMIPLINIVFLLLIFFMVAGKIVKQPSSEIELPSSSNASDVSPKNSNLAARLELFNNQRMHFNGESITLPSLAENIKNSQTKQLALFVDKNLSFGQLDIVTRELQNIPALTVTLFILPQLKGAS